MCATPSAPTSCAVASAPADVVLVAELMRHADTDTTRRYTLPNAVALTASTVTPAVVLLLVLYPAFDLLCAVIDFRSSGSARPGVALAVNMGLSTLAVIALAVFAATGSAAVLSIWGLWAITAGAVRLIVALGRRGLGGQWPMILSGGLSILVGAGFLLQATSQAPGPFPGRGGMPPRARSRACSTRGDQAAPARAWSAPARHRLPQVLRGRRWCAGRLCRHGASSPSSTSEPAVSPRRLRAPARTRMISSVDSCAVVESPAVDSADADRWRHNPARTSRSRPVTRSLTAPQGGGTINTGARIAMCGMIADYSADPAQRHGIRNLVELVEQRATAHGFLVTDHADRFDEITGELAVRLGDGRLRHERVVLEGLEHAPEALERLFRGDGRGKILVRVAPDDATGGAD
ncbi:hypothetical protein [Nocardiopsis sp. MG754419]|uniref:hypothetical protein n=1 Tax=Nocardiopsis sp. MG754419 TaxID=2259865 RepID=UPI002011C712|nr:hypothetical protein [Nocardiopsis sp. MG754419]